MRSLIVLLAAILSCNAGAAGELKIGGGAAPINNIFRKVQGPFEAKTGIKLVLSEEGPDLALKALDDGKLDIASAGLGQEDWLKLMEERKLSLKSGADMKYRVIGFDVIGIITHPAVKVPALSLAQLERIFRGEVANWKELGGADQKIVLVMGEKIPGTNRFFAQRVLKGAGYAKDAVWLPDGSAPVLASKVKATPGAISLAPLGLDTAGLSTPKIDRIGRPVSAATRGIPSEDAEKLYRFIQNEGKDLLK